MSSPAGKAGRAPRSSSWRMAASRRRPARRRKARAARPRSPRSSPTRSTSRSSASRSGTVTPPPSNPASARSRAARPRSAAAPCCAPRKASARRRAGGRGCARAMPARAAGFGAGRLRAARRRQRARQLEMLAEEHGGGRRNGRLRAALDLRLDHLPGRGRSLEQRLLHRLGLHRSRYGTPTIDELVLVDDAGIVVNPMLVEGQLIGGMAQGLGEALMERMSMTRTANCSTGSLMGHAAAAARESTVPPVTLTRSRPRRPDEPARRQGRRRGRLDRHPAAIVNAAGSEALRNNYACGILMHAADGQTICAPCNGEPRYEMKVRHAVQYRRSRGEGLCEAAS